jgi:hypothetical protein
MRFLPHTLIAFGIVLALLGMATGAITHSCPCPEPGATARILASLPGVVVTAVGGWLGHRWRDPWGR